MSPNPAVLTWPRPVASGSLAVDYLTILYETSPTGPKTWTGVAIGDADASRVIVVSVGYSGASTNALISVTIGGVAATIHVAKATTPVLAIASASVPTGTTADITVTPTSGSPSRYHVGVWRIVGGPVSVVASGTNEYADTTTHETTLNAAAGGVIIAHGYGTGTDVTWTGVTERWDGLSEVRSTGGDSSTSGATHTFSSTGSTAVAHVIQAATFTTA